VREVTLPDEPRFTHQAQEMKEDGTGSSPKIGGLPNADKPPGLFCDQPARCPWRA
jgi:hypothetical protein